MKHKILCVDDEPNVLEAFKRTLRKDYDVYSAEGGEQALGMIETEGPFAVVVSDMRMPGMNGIQFLSVVKEGAPDTVRIMLTGNSDQQTAIDAVNEGSIFRFLTKPCPPELLMRTLDAGLAHHELLSMEKLLLEQTLNKSLQVLVEILEIVNPSAFSRSTRIKSMARKIADSLGTRNSWEVEVAAMLSQIGCVTVPEEILVKVASGARLNDKETGVYHKSPEIGHDLIAQIPRMERVAEMVANQNRHMHDEIGTPADPKDIGDTVLGSRILTTILDYDKLIISGYSARHSFGQLSERTGWYDPNVLAALKDLIDLASEEYVELIVTPLGLEPGMLLSEDLISLKGSLLLSRGHEITQSLILRLINLSSTQTIKDTIQVKVLRSQLEAN